MADWEYKEDSWFRPVKPRMNQTTKIDSDDKTTYAFLEEGGLAFHLGKDGYPVRLQFNRLDGKRRAVWKTTQKIRRTIGGGREAIRRVGIKDNPGFHHLAGTPLQGRMGDFQDL